MEVVSSLLFDSSRGIFNNIEVNGILKYEKDDSFGFMAAVEYLVQSYQQKLQIFCVFMVACHINS